MTATIIPFPQRAQPGSGVPGRNRHAGPHRQPAAARFGAGGLTDRTEQQWFCEANHVLDQVESRLAAGCGRPSSTAEIIDLCEQAVWCLLGAAAEIDDGCAVMTLVDRLTDLHLRACRVDPPDPLRLASFVYRLASSEQMGVLHGVVDPYAPLLGRAGLADIRRRLADDERRVSAASGFARSILELRLRPIQASLARCDHPSAV